MATRIKLNLKGFRDLRTLPVMDDLVFEKAEAVARRMGDGFKAERSPGRNRARAVVVPDTAEAAIETAQHPQRLIAALDAARD